MKIYRIPAGLHAANCYIVVDEATNKSIIIDPGGSTEGIIEFINKNNLEIQYIVLTHGHADHIGGVIELKKQFNIPIIAHVDELELLRDSYKNLSSQMFPEAIEIEASMPVKDGDNIKFGNLEMEIIHTPGHTEGGMALKIENNLFTGDSLFKGSIGRSDFPGGNEAVLLDSIRRKLLIFSDDTIIWSGHGEETTVGEEKLFNPFLN